MNDVEKPFAPKLKLAIAKYHSGDHDGAYSDLQILARHFPNAAAVQGFLGGFRFLDGDYELALPHAQRAVELAPTKPAPARELILTLNHLGRYKEARDEILRSQPHLSDDEDVSEWEDLLTSVNDALGQRDLDA